MKKPSSFLNRGAEHRKTINKKWKKEKLLVF